MDINKPFKSSDSLIVEAVCFSCKNLTMYPRCLAFPDGIPQVIREGFNNHELPYPNDNGIQYEPVDDINTANV